MEVEKQEYYKWFKITEKGMTGDLTLLPSCLKFAPDIQIVFNNLSSHNKLNLGQISVDKLKVIIKILNKAVEIAEENK